MSILALLYMVLSCITTVVVPWLGVVFYYLLAIGQPAGLWPHHFGQDNRLSLFISLAIILGLGIATATRQVDWRRLFVLPSLAMMLVLVAINLSVAYSPFAEFVDVKLNKLSSAEMVDIFNKIMIIFFASILLIDTRFKLMFLITSVAGVLLYYVLWANKIYFTGEFWRFGDNGRLNGPWGVYHDENYLAMLYVVAVPIFYYLSVGASYRIIRYGYWLAIPLAWHALFLTGSRGALLSLIVTTLYIFFRSYNKKTSVILFVGLIVAIATQSGQLLNRITDTISVEEIERDRAFIENSDDSPEIDKPVDPRLISWEVGLSIMYDYPLLGIGAANFMRAFPQYEPTGSEPHVAHNTFVQFGAASGVGAALVYLYFLFLRLRNVAQKPNPEKKHAHGYKRDYLDDLLNSTFIGFYTVALFLDLMINEMTYFVFLAGICKYCLDARKKRTFRSLIDSIYNWRKDAEAEPVAIVEPDLVDGAIAPVHTVTLPKSAYGTYASYTESDNPAHEVPENQYADSSLYKR